MAPRSWEWARKVRARRVCPAGKRQGQSLGKKPRLVTKPAAGPRPPARKRRPRTAPNRSHAVQCPRPRAASPTQLNAARLRMPPKTAAEVARPLENHRFSSNEDATNAAPRCRRRRRSRLHMLRPRAPTAAGEHAHSNARLLAGQRMETPGAENECTEAFRKRTANNSAKENLGTLECDRFRPSPTRNERSAVSRR